MAFLRYLVSEVCFVEFVHPVIDSHDFTRIALLKNKTLCVWFPVGKDTHLAKTGVWDPPSG